MNPGPVTGVSRSGGIEGSGCAAGEPQPYLTAAARNGKRRTSPVCFRCRMSSAVLLRTWKEGRNKRSNRRRSGRRQETGSETTGKEREGASGSKTTAKVHEGGFGVEDDWEGARGGLLCRRRLGRSARGLQGRRGTGRSASSPSSSTTLLPLPLLTPPLRGPLVPSALPPTWRLLSPSCLSSRLYRLSSPLAFPPPLFSPSLALTRPSSSLSLLPSL